MGDVELKSEDQPTLSNVGTIDNNNTDNTIDTLPQNTENQDSVVNEVFLRKKKPNEPKLPKREETERRRTLKRKITEEEAWSRLSGEISIASQKQYATLRSLNASERALKHEEKPEEVSNSQIENSKESTPENLTNEISSETEIKETIAEESTTDETKTEISLSETSSSESNENVEQTVSDSNKEEEEYFEYYNDEEAAIEPDGTKAIGLWDFRGECESDLSFRKGDIVTIIRKYDNGWWEGELNGVIGDFPYNFVEVITQPEEDEDEPVNAFARNDSFSQLTSSDLMERTDQNDVTPSNNSNNNNKESKARPQSVARALPIKQGYLLKKGHKRRNWKIRFFVLESSKLSYFANPADAGVAKRMKGFITLQKSSSVKLAPEMKRSNCFAILSDVKPFVIYMAAPTGDEMVSWMESLSVARALN